MARFSFLLLQISDNSRTRSHIEVNPSPYRKFFSTLLVDMFEQPLAMAIEAITA